MSRADLFRGLGALCEAPGDEHIAISEALGIERPGDRVEEAATFMFEVHPYASVYLGDEGMLGGEARSRVSGFWLALGLTPPAEPDHLASLLGLLAALIDLEEAEQDPARALIRRQARSALVTEHLLPWIGPFLAAVGRVGTEHQIGWARVLRSALVAELDETGRPDLLPTALRAAAAVPGDPSEALALATAPARTGMVLTRTELVRGARAIGVGTRMGERAYALRAMADQDAAGTLAWLSEQAAVQAASHALDREDLGVVAGWWQDRAAHSARMLVMEEEATDVAG